MNLFEFLNNQSEGKLILYAIVTIIVIGIIADGIYEICKLFKKDK